MKKSLILIGTDHRIQQSVAPLPNNRWTKRTSPRFRKLVVHCVQKLGAQAILEEAHPKQEDIAPTICSQIAKELNVPWKAISAGEISTDDALFDSPVEDCIARGVRPFPLAGRYRLPLHKEREAAMIGLIGEALLSWECILAVVGYVHLGILAREFDAKGVDVQALLFTYPLVLNEALA